MSFSLALAPPSSARLFLAGRPKAGGSRKGGLDRLALRSQTARHGGPPRPWTPRLPWAFAPPIWSRPNRKIVPLLPWGRRG